MSVFTPVSLYLYLYVPPVVEKVSDIYQDTLLLCSEMQSHFAIQNSTLYFLIEVVEFLLSHQYPNCHQSGSLVVQIDP